MKKLLSYLGRFRYFALLVFMLGGFSSILQSLVIQRVIAIDTVSDFRSLWKLFIVGLLTYLLFYGLEFGANVVYDVACKRIMLALRDKLTRTLLLSGQAIDQHEATNFLSQDLEFFYDNYVTQVMRLPKDGMIFLVVAIYLITLNPLLAFLFIVGSLLRPLPQLFLTQTTESLGKRQSDERERSMSLIIDYVNGSSTLLRHQAFESTYDQLENQVLTYETARRNYYYLSNFLFFCNGLTQFLGRVVPIGLYFLLPIVFGHIPVSSLVAMFMASNHLANPLQNMMYATFSMQATASVKARIDDMIDQVADEAETPYVPYFKALALEGITKSYGAKLILKDFSYTFEQGKKYLIKGASGRGKSTLLHIIKGTAVDSGKIAFITKDNHSFESYQANIGMVSQAPFLFNGTLEENICLNQEFSKEDILAVLDQVHLLEELPAGLGFQIENNGTNISGGQRVRIELARFLLRQKDILLLDEVTAALDKDNARRVRELIFSLPITIIEVAHHVDQAIAYDDMIEL
ncbi:ABC transporter ATP-binding protein [Streptococcus equi subsp. zooepidemicus]|uniref:ATP-binding cassette domain-containing protein n=1 Tax=Streptococcus equi TaxID=1336 RepID=UPI00021747D0|nr:ABC transporter ATP-binding protein [Streptococcus equi]AEJ25016.1 ATP-binding/permease protein [Streptococcus equi subsp. zooepidemicus ATCC 35246]AIA68761.1 ABC transporter ATP-binding protein [Streptococcus equi subsp. zooepidemicus CY]MBR7684489.1 ABC transporter ATP-binding protein [Streptococcus equi subsp. zooepidemicus]MBR7753576.1 ABC transporter ATP-binding protein [Streptococcus equi subsp. zooepidemicus]MBR7776555.1 ABC transporter ATP-binding protein [Streptococcus equi subsp. 